MFKVFDCGRTKTGYNAGYKEDCKLKHEMFFYYLRRECLQIGEQTSCRQPQELVPREVELSKDRKRHSEAFEIIAAQVQHLDMIQYELKNTCCVCRQNMWSTIGTSRVVGRQGVMVVSLAPEMLRCRRVEGQEQLSGMEL